MMVKPLSLLPLSLLPLALGLDGCGASPDDQYATKTPPPGPNAQVERPATPKQTSAAMHHLSMPSAPPPGGLK